MVLLKHKLSSNSSADLNDVRIVKKALNKIGHYKPLDKTGITSFPDRELFEALKDFQRSYSLPVTGHMRPDDVTFHKLMEESSKSAKGFTSGAP